MLKKSEDMCRASLQEDDEVEEEDVDRETGIIRVQLAYAIQMQVIREGQFYRKFTVKALLFSGRICIRFVINSIRLVLDRIIRLRIQQIFRLKFAYDC
jgi:hypothetical protein